MKNLSRREFMGTGMVLTTGALALMDVRPAFPQMTQPSQEVYQTLKDQKIISELEMKHVPLIDAPDRVKKGEAFSLNVRIGRTLHPMEKPHHIEWIHIMKKGGIPLAAGSLSYEGITPSAALNLALSESTEIHVKILCNIHGYWMETKKIEVV